VSAGMRAAIRESLANLIFTPRRSLVMIALAVLLLGSTMVLESSNVAALLRDSASRVAQGEYVAVVSSAANEPTAKLKSDACELLGGLPGVRASGSIKRAAHIVFSTSPSQRIAHFEVSPGALQVLGSAPTEAELVVGGAIATDLGLLTSGILGIAGADTRKALVLSEPSIRTGLVDYAVMSVTPPSGYTDVCLVEFESTSPVDATIFISGLLQIPADSVQVKSLEGIEQLGPSPAYAYEKNLARLSWLITAPAFATLWLILSRSRRSELALYKSFGASPLFMAMMGICEQAATLTVAALPCVGASLVAANGEPIALAHAMRVMCLFTLASLGIATLGTFRHFLHRDRTELLRGSE